MNPVVDEKIDRAYKQLKEYADEFDRGSLIAARAAAYALVKIACELHSAADPGASRKNGSEVAP